MNEELTTKGTKTKAYPKYKPSGVEWLGDVPEHWEVKALRYICRIETGDKDTVDAEDDGEYPFFVRSQTIERINTYTKNCEAVLTAGDGVGVGKVFHYINGKFDFHQRVYMFSNFKKVTGRFFFHFFRENFWRVALEGGAKSTVDSLRRPMISSFPFIIPPLPEQQAIASFLDRETGRIDSLIGKKQRLLQLLAEQRTALISRAVTKGLDASVKLKPSGVEWLGDVPEHWGVKKIRHTFSFRSGGTPSTENPDFWDGNIPWVSSKDMKSFYIKDTEDHINEIAVKESATSIIPANTMVVVMRSGILIHSIPASVLMYDMAINQDIKAFLPAIKLSSVYFARFIEGFQKQLLTEWRKEGATVESLDMELIKNFKIILPPLPEQQSIAAYLDCETAKIDTLSAKVGTVIEQLKEYRTALISSAVTGTIDVQEAV